MPTKKSTSKKTVTPKQESKTGRRTANTVNVGLTKSRRYCNGGKLKR